MGVVCGVTEGGAKPKLRLRRIHYGNQPVPGGFEMVLDVEL